MVLQSKQNDFKTGDNGIPHARQSPTSFTSLTKKYVCDSLSNVNPILLQTLGLSKSGWSLQSWRESKLVTSNINSQNVNSSPYHNPFHPLSRAELILH